MELPRFLPGSPSIADRLNLSPLMSKASSPRSTNHHSPASSGSVTGLLSALGECDALVLAEIWRRFFPRMAGLARRTLAGLPNCGVEAEEVAQSAFISFWRALDRNQSYVWNGRDDLWRMLAVITSRKAHRLVRHETAQKRAGGGATWAEEPNDVLGRLSPVEFDLIGEEMLLGLNERRRSIALLRLQGHTDDEIAERIGCSRRSVERELAAIRQQWNAAEVK